MNSAKLLQRHAIESRLKLSVISTKFVCVCGGGGRRQDLCVAYYSK